MTDSSAAVHLMPFSIEFDGTAPVGSYFGAGEPVDNVAHFRGRKLIQKKLTLPENLVGRHMVLPAGQSGSDRKAELGLAFKQFSIWGHGVQPLGQDVQQCLDWMELNDAVNS